MGNPFVKLLPLIDPNEASADFARIRGTQPRTNITYNVASPEVIGAASDGVTSTEATLDRLNTLIPIMLGVMGLNALVLLSLIVIGIVYVCWRKKSRAARRARRQDVTPMPMSSMENAEAAEPTHQYEPVMSDEQLTPQSPSVLSFDSMGRPQSWRPVSNAPSQAFSSFPGNLRDPFKTPPPSFQRDSRGVERGIRPHSSYQPIDTQVARINAHLSPTSAPADDGSLAPPSPGFFRRDFAPGTGDNQEPGNAEGIRPNSIA